MDKQRLLIIGAKGFLGEYAAKAVGDSLDIIKADREGAPNSGETTLDVTDAASVNRALDTFRPDLVLLLAAMSDIDQCERFPELASQVNVRGAENVANACARSRTRLLFTSSAAVFDGEKHGYEEEDPVSPLSTYGRTKAKAEEVIRLLLPAAVIVRIALVLGFARNQGTNAMLNRLTEQWHAGQAIQFPTYEIRNPIDAAWLSELLLRLVTDEKFRGIYHVGASDGLSRYELARQLAKRTGVPDGLVLPQDTPIPGRAPRGADHFLLTTKLSRDCGVKVPTTAEVIERCLS